MQFLDRPMSQDPSDQLLLEIRGAVAEYERTLITERRKGATPFRQQDWYRGSGPAMRCWRRLLSIARHPVGGEGTDPFILTPGGNVRYDGGKAQGVLMAPDI